MPAVERYPASEAAETWSHNTSLRAVLYRLPIRNWRASWRRYWRHQYFKTPWLARYRAQKKEGR